MQNGTAPPPAIEPMNISIDSVFAAMGRLYVENQELRRQVEQFRGLLADRMLTREAARGEPD